MTKELTVSERRYLENEEFNKNNVEEVLKPKASKAKAFRDANGYSLTFAKLMKKWNCATQDEYRAIRRAHKKEGYVGPTKEKKKPEVVETVNQGNYKGKNFNKNHSNKNNYNKK